MAFTAKTQRAIEKYGKQTCLDAYEDNLKGNGARTIGYEHDLTTNQADAAINAGREITMTEAEQSGREFAASPMGQRLQAQAMTTVKAWGHNGGFYGRVRCETNEDVVVAVARYLSRNCVAFVTVRGIRCDKPKWIAEIMGE